MKIKLYLIIAGVILSFILAGCGAKPSGDEKAQTKTEDKKISSFTNNLQTAGAEYTISFVMTSAVIQEAVKLTKDDSEAEKDINEYLKAPGGMGASESAFGFTNAQNSIDYITKADPDFQYIYTTYKTLPPSFKDDFLNMKNLIDENINLIHAFRRGELHKDNLQSWMDNDKKIHDLYESISLEVQRIQN
ncbi:MAG TPA: hypothetical protein VHY30_04205 [Verrucomicrobiae bacterium]|jgi:hypothetical protein|nr:hypothetical protein [Verrucomicrobiae bacterium]